MASDYDKLKDMYRREGMEEQSKRFQAMVGTPQDDLPSPSKYTPVLKEAADLQALNEKVRQLETRLDTATKLIQARNEKAVAAGTAQDLPGGLKGVSENVQEVRRITPPGSGYRLP